VYRLLKEYRNRRILSILFAKLLLGEKVKLIVDGTILEVANLNRARTQKIKRFSGKALWGKKKRNLYSEHYKEKVRFEEMYYRVLVMVVCDSEGVAYDLRKGITLLAYLYGYAIGYSFFRNSQIWG
jgi:hypothetical protein